jgi:gamma-glutamylcyclotransferase (GGCT)/AIG2-like uncharacterized protein YtfP
METIFVYGTLKQGYGNHIHYLNKPPLTQGILKGYHLLGRPGGGFPCIGPGDGYVEGEVYEVDEEELKAIDRLEGHPTWYLRTNVQVTSKENKTMNVWTYVMIDKEGWEPYGKTNWIG